MSWRVSPKKTVFAPNLSLLPVMHTSYFNEDLMNMIEGALNKPRTEANQDLVELLKDLDARCRACAPLNPLECVTRCNLWKLKNELRQLRDRMDDPNYIKELLNVLKNNTRLQILKTIAKGKHSVIRLQEELKKAGYTHSRDTINQEYLQPLMHVGLAAEAQEQYYATTFGGKLTEVLEDFSDFVNVLPAHSECYEETLLDAMLCGPKTFEDMAAFVSPKIASRILKRLKTSSLIETPENRDYIFFFRSKRDPEKESFSLTEKKVYRNIPDAGIPARKLAKKTDLSLRRTYKYLRGLKGKKLVFTRKTPKVYTLTKRGEKLAQLIRGLQGVVEEVWQSSWHVVTTEKS
jgi:predicted transcriptional regulator